MQNIIDKDSGQVFTVEECEPGVFQSVFPERLAEFSCLHDTEQDALDHIAEVCADEASANSQFGVGA